MDDVFWGEQPCLGGEESELAAGALKDCSVCVGVPKLPH